MPSIVLEGAQRALAQGYNVYTRFDGLPELREAVARKLAHYNGIQADPERDITVSAGATGAFHCACAALLDPGGEVILFEPYYQYHISALLAVEATPIIVNMQAPDWTFAVSQLEEAVTLRTKTIIVNSQGNPSGRVFARDELEAIATFACRRDLFVFTDEIYEYFLYDGRRHLSIAALPNMAERTVTIGGYSKTFSVTGWRIGYSVAAGPWSQAIGAMNDLLYVCAPAPLQMGVASGINELPDEFYQDRARSYQQKRDHLCAALTETGLTRRFRTEPIMCWQMCRNCRAEPGKVARCTFWTKAAWPVFREKLSSRGKKEATSFASATLRPTATSKKPAAV